MKMAFKLQHKPFPATFDCMPCLQADLTSSQQSAADKQQQLTLVSEQLTAAEGKAADLSKHHQDAVQQLQQQEALLSKVTSPRHQVCSLRSNSTFVFGNCSSSCFFLLPGHCINVSGSS